MYMRRLQQKETRCTKVSAADTFNLQQVSDGVSGRVQVGANWPDIRRYWSESLWRILPWHASDSKATVCDEWDLCRILYLPTMQCPCCGSPRVRDNQLPGTTDTSLAFIASDLWHPTAQIWTRLTTQMGEKQQQVYALELFGRCALQIYLLAYLLTYLLTKFMTSMNWINAWSMSGMVLSSVVSDAGDKWQKRLCVCICVKVGNFEHTVQLHAYFILPIIFF